MVLINLKNRIEEYGTLVMFSHTIFSLSFALMSMILAGGGVLPFHKLFWILLAFLSARTGANAINRVIDADFDKKNERTRSRQIPQGILKKKEVLIFSMACFALMMVAISFINTLCVILSPIALFLLIIYSYTKRFTFLCHLVLGVTTAMAPVGAWLAMKGDESLEKLIELGSYLVNNHIHILSQPMTFHIMVDFMTFFALPILMGLANILWVSGFDIIYGSQDYSFDRDNGLHSMAVKFGVSHALTIAKVFHMLTMILLIGVGLVSEQLNQVYYIGLGLIGGLFIIEHKLVRPDNLTNVKIASYGVNQLISIAFLLFGVLDAWI